MTRPSRLTGPTTRITSTTTRSETRRGRDLASHSLAVAIVSALLVLGVSCSSDAEPEAAPTVLQPESSTFVEVTQASGDAVDESAVVFPSLDIALAESEFVGTGRVVNVGPGRDVYNRGSGAYGFTTMTFAVELSEVFKGGYAPGDTVIFEWLAKEGDVVTPSTVTEFPELLIAAHEVPLDAQDSRPIEGSLTAGMKTVLVPYSQGFIARGEGDAAIDASTADVKQISSASAVLGVKTFSEFVELVRQQSTR